jgi:FkbM family methyltransferase
VSSNDALPENSIWIPSPEPEAVIVSYSQNAEDVRLARVFDSSTGFYVDVGAGDPTEFSVTKHFYDRGWSGINVEPGPAFERLEQERPRDVNLRLAVAPESGTREFWVSIPHSGLSRLSPPDPSTPIPEGVRFERRPVATGPLSDIIREHAADKAIDFMTVDVEGAEDGVIRSMDFELSRPKVVVVEAIAPLTHEPAYFTWEPILLAAGYEFAAFDGINRFYVGREHRHLAPALAYPVSALDGYVLASAPAAAPVHDAGEPPPRPVAAGLFPTLAERLDRRTATNDVAVPSKPLVILVEADAAPALVPPTVAAVRAAVPPSSLVGIVEGGAVRTSVVAEGDTHDAPRSHERPFWRLDDVRALLDAAPERDVVVVEPGYELTAGTLGQLASAAYADSVCASVSVIDPADAPASPAPACSGIPPAVIDHPSWGLVYMRRDMLEVALDNALAIGNSASSECRGLRALLESVLRGAGFVHRGTTAAPNAGAPTGRPTRVEASDSSLIRVTMDARSLATYVSGTQMQFLNLLYALARTGEVRLTALTPPEIHPSALPLVEALRDDVLFAERDSIERADVYHRPHQVRQLGELSECLTLGRRFVLTQQDMILDRTRAFFPSREAWTAFRRVTRAALASADHVGFFSEHAALDAASDGLIDLDRATVVPLGVDHFEVTADAAQPPPQLVQLAGRPFLFNLGTSLEHKNRLFAFRVLHELVERGWEGGLVLAGGDVPWGSSVADEERFLDRAPHLRERVTRLGTVQETQKQALYRDAALTLFPSFYEGFGFIPFESAAHGTPCLYAWRGPVREFLPRGGALPTDFSVPTTATRILQLLGDLRERETLVSEIRAFAASLTWEKTARGYVEVYRRALGDPPRRVDRIVIDAPTPARAGGVALSEMELAVLDVYRRRPGFRASIDSMIRVGAHTTRAARAARAPFRRTSGSDA